MMKSLFVFSALLSLLLFPAASFAAKGRVIAFNANCGYLLVKSHKGSLLLKQQGNSTFVPVAKDVIDGFQIETYGINYLKKVSTGEIMWVYNGFGWLASDDAINKYTAACGPIPSTNPIIRLLTPSAITTPTTTAPTN